MESFSFLYDAITKQNQHATISIIICFVGFTIINAIVAIVIDKWSARNHYKSDIRKEIVLKEKNNEEIIFNCLNNYKNELLVLGISKEERITKIENIRTIVSSSQVSYSKAFHNAFIELIDYLTVATIKPQCRDLKKERILFEKLENVIRRL